MGLNHNVQKIRGKPVNTFISRLRKRSGRDFTIFVLPSSPFPSCRQSPKIKGRFFIFLTVNLDMAAEVPFPTDKLSIPTFEEAASSNALNRWEFPPQSYYFNCSVASNTRGKLVSNFEGFFFFFLITGNFEGLCHLIR